MVIFVWFGSNDTTGRHLGFPDTAIILNIELIISMSMLYHVPSMLGSENKAAKIFVHKCVLGTVRGAGEKG